MHRARLGATLGALLNTYILLGALDFLKLFQFFLKLAHVLKFRVFDGLLTFPNY